MFRLNIVNDNTGLAFMSTSKLNDLILWHARMDHVHFKRMQDMSKDGLIPAFDMDTEKCKTCMLTKITKKPFQNVKRETEVLKLIHSDLYDLHATLSLKNKKYFVAFIDYASRFCYVYLLHTKDEPLDKFKVFKTEVEVQQGSLIKSFRTDRGGRVPNPCSSSIGKTSIIESRDTTFDDNRFSSVSRPSLRILNGTKDIGVSVVPKEVTKEVVKQPEPELRKSKRNRTPKEFGSEFQLYLIEGTRDECCFLERSNQHLGFKWIFKRKLKVDGTIEMFKARFSMKDIEEDDVIFGIRIKHESNGIVISQSHYIEKYSRVIEYLMYAMTCTRPDIAFAVGKLSKYTSNPGYPSVLEGYTVASWISNTEDNSSTSGWVFLLGGAAAGKEAEWLKTLLFEIPLWFKPMTPISICCDSATTLAKAYSQITIRSLDT
ncbi:zinc finger, CCHC-type containing protein [Tanacetum coccineum]